MEYILAIPEALGDISVLYNVAVAKAKKKANASNRGFHQPTYDGALPEYISVLIAEAQNGRLQVCDQFGLRGMPSQIISDAKLKSRIEEYESDENLIIALNVYVNLYQLNVWAREQGDVFCKKHEWVPYIDERGWNNFEVEPPSLKVEFKLETRPIQKQASQVAPVGVVGPSGGMETAKAGPLDLKPWLIADSTDPTPKLEWYTPARYFARQLVVEDSKLLLKKLVLADKVATSLKNAGIYKRGGKKPYDASTVLKAFANVTLG